MGGGISSNHTEVFAEHGITSAEDQAKYKAMYLSMQQNGVPEDQIMADIKKVSKKEKESKDAGKTKESVSTRDPASKRRRSLDKISTKLLAVSTRRGSKDAKELVVPAEPEILPYLCEVCNKGFKTFVLLDCHMRLAEDHARCVREKEKQNIKGNALSVKVVDAAPRIDPAESNENADTSLSAPAADTSSAVIKEYTCEFCATNFSSFILLDRHIRYSDRHAKALKEREEKINTDERARKIAEVANKYISLLQSLAQQTKQAESHQHSVAWHRWQKAYRKVKLDNLIKKSEHYLIDAYRVNKIGLELHEPQLLFRGSKLFWRTQDHYNFHIFHHNHPEANRVSAGGKGIIEVIGFNSKQVDFDYDIRLYLNYAPLLALVQKDMNIAIAKLKRTSVSTRRRSLNTSLPGGSEYSEEVVSEAKAASVANDILGTMIVDRLQVETVPGSIVRMQLVFTAAPVKESGSSAIPTMPASAGATIPDETQGKLPCVLEDSVALAVVKPVVVNVVANNTKNKESLVLADQIRSELASITNRAENLVSYVGSAMAQVQDLAVSSVHKAKLAYTSELRRQVSEGPRAGSSKGGTDASATNPNADTVN